MLVFTPTNWHRYQTVVVTASADGGYPEGFEGFEGFEGGHHWGSLVHHATSADLNYNGSSTRSGSCGLNVSDHGYGHKCTAVLHCCFALLIAVLHCCFLTTSDHTFSFFFSDNFVSMLFCSSLPQSHQRQQLQRGGHPDLVHPHHRAPVAASACVVFGRV